MSHSELLEANVIMKGRVQGVGLRRAAKFLAEQLQVTGYIRNLSDGSVEIYVQGKKMELYSFISQLQEAFPNSAVDHVQFTPVASSTYETFDIS